MKTLRWLTVACGALGLACGSPAESTTTPVAAGTDEVAVADATTRIHGALLGHDGEPIPLAQIHVSLTEHQPIEVPVAADGSFTLELPGPGWASLRLTGVSHEEHSLEFLASGGEHELTVRLGTYDRPETIKSVMGFGWFDGEGGRVNLAFERRDDGTWVSTVKRGEKAGAEAKEFHYQIANVTSEGRTINGTQADRYEYDGGGDYISVVTLGDADSFEIVYDPRAMPPAGAALALNHGDPDSSFARAVALRGTVEGWRAEVVDPGADSADAKTRIQTRIAEAAAAEADPAIKRMLLVAWLGTLSRSERDEHPEQVEPVKQALAVVGPRDPVWAMDPWALASALAYVDDPQYFAIAANEHPDPSVSATLWFSTLIAADQAGELERGREAMAALQTPRYAEVGIATMANMYDPDRPTAPGRTVPDFVVSSADGKTNYSAADLRGKTYLLDFWATWCAPCIAEMPRLHAAYATLNGQAEVEGRAYVPVAKPTLEILSISLDHDAKLVAKFRKDEWPMPWAHAVPDEAAHEQLSAAFGIVGIPMMVLVGPEGTILASSPRLDGGNLHAIAAEHLN